MRWWTPALPLLLVLAALGRAAPAASQLPAAERAVILALLPALREALPPGRAVLDPEILCRTRLAGWQCPPEVIEAAASTDFDLHGASFTHVCPGGPDTCRLVGTESLVVLDPPRITRGRATVAARVWRETADPARPVASHSLLLHLRRTRSGWTVVGVRGEG